MTINLVNNKKYIGIDSRNNPHYLGGGTILKKAIEKYGRENFHKIILEECNSKEELFNKEREWITLLNATNDKNFYNILSGGQGSLGQENQMFHTNLYNIWKEKYGDDLDWRAGGYSFVAYDPEVEKTSFHKKNGIPILPEVINELKQISNESNIHVPDKLSKF